MIADAVSHEQRIRFHTDVSLSQRNAEQYSTEFLGWVKDLIPEQKYQMFCSLFRYPGKTVELTEQIYSALAKIFDGKNAVYNYEFTTPEAAQDWDNYRGSVLDQQKVWQTKGMHKLQSQPNSVLIVDMPEDSADAYWYWLPIDSVLDYKLEEDGVTFDYIIFYTDEDEIAVFDDEAVQVYDYKDKELGEQKRQAVHGLDYCPARFFLSDPVNYRLPGVKLNPISKQLGDLDWYLFFAISERHLDLYGAYPIYWGFSQDCDYQAPDNSRDGFVYCDSGFLRRDSDNTYVLTRSGSRGHGHNLQRCPACSKRRLNGAGSFVEVTPPGLENDKADLRDPVGIVSVDRNSLDYVTEKRKRYALEIFQATTGTGGEMHKDQAINEKQVQAAFESKAQVLRNLKRQFEQAQQWVDETICRMRYGASFVSAHINYGTEFYLHEPAELLEMYQQAKKAGVDDKILDMLQNEYYAVKYKNNPNELLRVQIMSDLDPFRHLDKNQVQGMYAAGQIEYTDYMLKMNFSTLIARFERENISLIQFGEALEYSTKIQRILSVLSSYIQQPNVADESSESLAESITAYGTAVRAGAVTPQSQDENYFRKRLGIPEMSEEVSESWEEGGNTRRPVTLKTEQQFQDELTNSPANDQAPQNEISDE